MSDVVRKYTKKVVAPKTVKKPAIKAVKVPARDDHVIDASFWKNKVYKTKDGREIIETDQSKDGANIAE